MSLPAWLVAALLLINLAALPFVAFLLLTSLVAVLGGRRGGASVQPAERFLVMIPAHNEEGGIGTTVSSCLAIDYPAGLFEVLVIADNCTDRTASVARDAGATVVERSHETKRSKGFAIEYLIERLKESGRFEQLDALVLVDADTVVEPNILRSFADLIRSGGRWGQCYYTVANPDASWRTRLMTYAFALFNGVTPLGLSRLGQSVGFRGNGMCLTTEGLRRVPWTSYGLVEDMEFSWKVRLAGETIAFRPDTAVRGLMLSQGGKAAADQRQRWEHGRREIARRLPAAILRSDRLGLLEKLACLIEVRMPTMMILLPLMAALLAANAVVMWTTQPVWIVATLAILSAMMAVAIVATTLGPFLCFGLPWRYALSLAYVPVYAFWKLLLALRPRPDRWVRTVRE
ncbi:glycosyltransferase family 2 protein [Aquisphaera insulae]|uniref:glycosyltransferase family 2 protein n=1 Tax=Aquisphaera insulae TaxID=2712864 RepID=UPI0013EC68BA|nr:glycosyltransferase family 2 protein [Aquisphaera insulae]